MHNSLAEPSALERTTVLNSEEKVFRGPKHGDLDPRRRCEAGTGDLASADAVAAADSPSSGKAATAAIGPREEPP